MKLLNKGNNNVLLIVLAIVVGIILFLLLRKKSVEGLTNDEKKDMKDFLRSIGYKKTSNGWASSRRDKRGASFNGKTIQEVITALSGDDDGRKGTWVDNVDTELSPEELKQNQKYITEKQQIVEQKMSELRNNKRRNKKQVKDVRELYDEDISEIGGINYLIGYLLDSIRYLETRSRRAEVLVAYLNEKTAKDETIQKFKKLNELNFETEFKRQVDAIQPN